MSVTFVTLGESVSPFVLFVGVEVMLQLLTEHIEINQFYVGVDAVRKGIKYQVNQLLILTAKMDKCMATSCSKLNQDP